MKLPAVAFGIDRFVVTVTPPCVFEGSADHGAGCRRAVEMPVNVVDHDVHFGRGLAGLTRAVEVACSGPERPIINVLRPNSSHAMRRRPGLACGFAHAGRTPSSRTPGRSFRRRRPIGPHTALWPVHWATGRMLLRWSA